VKLAHAIPQVGLFQRSVDSGSPSRIWNHWQYLPEIPPEKTLCQQMFVVDF
jgi:hypothetical protein